MPVITSIDFTLNGERVKIPLRVKSDGHFYMTVPSEVAAVVMCDEVRCSTALAAENEMRSLFLKFQESASKKRRVIAVKFSTNTMGERRRCFHNRDATLEFRMGCFIETTITVGGTAKLSYKYDPEWIDMHVECPISWPFRLEERDVNHRLDHIRVIEWSETAQAKLVSMVNSLERIIEMIGDVTETNDAVLDFVLRSDHLLPPVAAQKQNGGES